VHIDQTTPEEEAEWIVEQIAEGHLNYLPFSFWEDQDYYLETLVEKIDLKSLFATQARRFYIPIANAKGWADLHSRAAMVKRFAYWAAQGKQCVLLYCGDFDPKGLQMSDCLRANLAEMVPAAGVDWSPDALIIDRFGLNLDFIEEHKLTWIDGLITGSGKDLGDDGHKHHGQAYVQTTSAVTASGKSKRTRWSLTRRLAASCFATRSSSISPRTPRSSTRRSSIPSGRRSGSR
jgi:hypothetical protein